jgi:hypothetical protein
MATMQRSTVVGVFDDRGQAEKAVRELRDAGFSKEQIGFAMRGSAADEGGEDTSVIHSTPFHTYAGGVTGTVAGGVLGGLLGTLASAVIPGIGPVVGAGLLVMIVSGAYVGGVAGALIGMGIPEEEAHQYHREFEAGRALVTVKVDGRYSEALAILSANGAKDVIRREADVNATRG